MKAELYAFRLADEILSARPAWAEILSVIDSISADKIILTHREIAGQRRRPPAGGQTAINLIFERELSRLGWRSQPYLFLETSDRHRRWKMDFIKDRIGVEVVFNHAEAVPWAFTRLNLAGESGDVLADNRIDLGIAIFAGDGLKTWAKMDSAVGTFDLAKAWLGLMRPILPVPLMMVGLEASDWPPTDEFRGTAMGGRPGVDYGTPPGERLLNPEDV